MKTVNVIEAVFFAALDKKDAGERAAYLDKACSGDPDLRRCVEKLLAAQPKVGEFLQAPAPGLPAAANGATVDHAADARPGTVLGPYKLLHEIGEGGMGTVWMAEQTAPVKRRVALKVIKPGMDSRQVLARFEAERQALALMDHPNIAKVLDAGATDGGRPYFVMELVKGQPITEFCDKNRLTTPERLELFVAVCNAIQHAHQKGVIHRDIKPTNVLVALYDGKPVPKVIDFGVAKAVVEPLTDKTLFTRHGQVVGTFEYMSPEQANLDQLDVDTRSDVYALGVLLYELLTGTTPLDKERLRSAGLAEVLRLIREEEPPKPSTRLTSTPGLLSVAAAYRKTDSQKLPRAVRGELDWIVMKALDKDRNRRFATANGLAADVERFLTGEPVQACPPTLAYRFRKWARKNKVAFATTSAVAAALLVGLALTSWQAVRATNAERGTQHALADALDLSQKLDGQLGEIQSKNEQIRREQSERRAGQYAWDMLMVSLMWEYNNPGEARRLLERQIPKSDEKDLRRFEWNYWNRQTHTEHSFTLKDAAEPNAPRGSAGRNMEWFLSADGSRVVHADAPLAPAALRRDIGGGTIKVWDVATRELLLKYTPAEDESISPSPRSQISRDGKVLLVTGSILAKEKPDPNSGVASPFASSLPGWVRVLEVDTQKVLFDSRKELSGAWVRAGALLISDGRKLITHESEEPKGEGQEARNSGVQHKVWDLGAADRKPVTIKDVTLWAIVPDGSRLFSTAQLDGKETRKCWDTATGKEVGGLDYLLTPAVKTFVFSPDGTLHAVVEFDDPQTGVGRVRTERRLKVYEAKSGKELFAYDCGAVTQRPSPRPDPVLPPSVLFAPDSSKMAVEKTPQRDSGTPNERTEWQILDARSGNVLATFDDPGGSSNERSGVGIWHSSAPRFSADGTQFILAADNMIYTFDTTTGQPVHTLRGCESAIQDMVVLPDGKLRTLEVSATIREWDLGRVEPVRTAIVEQPEFDPDSGSLNYSWTFSVDGAWVAVYTRRTSDDGTVESVSVWDAAGKGRPVKLEAPARNWPAGVRPPLSMPHLSADGKRVALFRSTQTFPPAGRPGGEVGKIDPTTLPPADVTVWDVASQHVIFQRELPRDSAFRLGAGIPLSPDGGALAIIRREGDFVKPKSTLTFVDVNANRDGKSIEVDGNITGGAFSPDGKRFEGEFTTGPARGMFPNIQIAVWDVATGSRMCTIENVPADPFFGPRRMRSGPGATCWSLDGKRLATAGPDGAQLYLFDTADGKLVKSLDVSNRGDRITTASRGGVLAFSPDGERIACVVEGRSPLSAKVNVLDAEGGKELLSLPLSRSGFNTVLRFTPDGHKLLLFAAPVQYASPAGAPLPQAYIDVTTWDATPLPEPMQP